VVGAGPGGAVLSLLLARAGVRVTLLERHTDFSREFRGEVLMPSGLEPFEEMGLWEEFDALPHVPIAQFRIFVGGRFIQGVEMAPEHFGRFAPRWVSQPPLLEMLVAEAGRLPNFTLERGASVRHLLAEQGRTSGVGILTPAGEREDCADLVVGADGRTSIVRRRSGASARTDPIPMDIVWLKLPLPDFEDEAEGRALRGYAGGGHLLIAGPTPDDKLQLAWVIRKGSFGDLRERGMPAAIHEMARHVDPPLAAHLRAHAEDAIQPFLLSTVSDYVEEWAAPGRLLIGDAAHTMSPVGAQGINMAIRDAVVAARHLGPVLAGDAAPADIDRAAAAVQAERSHEIRTIQKFQRRAPPVLLNDFWWNRALLSILPRFARSEVLRPRNSGVFGRLAWGVSEVRVQG
ncbi:MAG: FAD-dependent monooxygenase, partial [Myxococcota bacterium]